MADTEEVPKKNRTVSKTSSMVLQPSAIENDDGGKDDPRELKRKLSALATERDRLRSQRDTYSKQFEELTKTRSEGEGLYEKYKSKAELQAKAQNDIIASQTALTEKLQAKVKALEKALSSASASATASGSEGGVQTTGGVSDSGGSGGKVDPKEVKALRDDLAKINAESKGKDDKIAQLQREYKAEVEHSRSLQAAAGKGTSSSAPAGPSSAINTNTNTMSEEAAKDAKSLALYEDLTMLNIANVKIKSTKIGDETTFNCILSMDGQSLNFKLRCYNEIDKTQTPPYVKSVHYIPEQSTLQHEPASFVKRLDYFATEFVIPRDQLGGFFLELRAKMSPEDEE